MVDLPSKTEWEESPKNNRINGNFNLLAKRLNVLIDAVAELQNLWQQAADQGIAKAGFELAKDIADEQKDQRAYTISELREKIDSYLNSEEADLGPLGIRDIGNTVNRYLDWLDTQQS